MNLTDNYTIVNSCITLLSYNRYSIIEHTKIQALDRDSEEHWKMERIVQLKIGILLLCSVEIDKKKEKKIEQEELH